MFADVLTLTCPNCDEMVELEPATDSPLDEQHVCPECGYIENL